MGEEVQLDFENQMFVELLAEDGLIVLARLGLQRFMLIKLILYVYVMLRHQPEPYIVHVSCVMMMTCL